MSRRGIGHRAEFDGERQISGTERETYTCCHCPKITRVEKLAGAQASGTMCFKCNQMMCYACSVRAQQHGCEPFRAKIDKWLTRHEMFKSL